MAIIIRENGTIDDIEIIWTEHAVIYNIANNRIGIISRRALGFLFLRDFSLIRLVSYGCFSWLTISKNMINEISGSVSIRYLEP